MPADIKVCIVADRGFGDQKLYRVLTEELKFDFVIRFRGNITVTAADGEVRTASGWVGHGGRARVLRGAAVTTERYPGGDGVVRAGQGHEAGVVSRRQRRRGINGKLERALWQALMSPADSGDLERLVRSIMNADTGDHEHPLALACVASGERPAVKAGCCH
ncbi:MAG: hypothetical protein M0002_07790 [Rhodospirillales bacterium]|nr:hypothetical protein [Rhodospirillales bacterium]